MPGLDVLICFTVTAFFLFSAVQVFVFFWTLGAGASPPVTTQPQLDFHKFALFELHVWISCMCGLPSVQ